LDECKGSDPFDWQEVAQELFEEREAAMVQRDHHRKTLRQLWSSPTFRDAYGGYMRERELWLTK